MDLNSLKRSSNSDTPLAKRLKPLDELSEDGPLTQEDVVYFQKEAIWRQMKSYKLKCINLSKNLVNYKRKYEENESKLNILDVWYEQILQAFEGFRRDSKDVNENLLIKFGNLTKDDVDDILVNRRQQLLQLLTPIFEESKINISSDKKDLIQVIEELNLKVSKLLAENGTLTNTKQTIEESIIELNERLLVFEKEKNRSESKTLGRIDPNKDAVKIEVSDNNNVPSTSSNGIDNQTAQSVKDSEDFKAQQIELEDLKVKYKELEVISDKSKEKLEQLHTDSNKSAERCHELNSKLNNLTEADLQACQVYKNLTSLLKKYQDQIDDLQKANSLAIRKLGEFEKNRGDIKKIVDQVLLADNESLKNQLTKCESDLVRIRTARDELLSKVNIHKSEGENKNVVEELQKTIKVLNERLRKYELNEDKTNNNGSIDNMEDEKLKTLSNEELMRRLKLLNSEIKEVEQAFQDTRELTLKKLFTDVETENSIRKLSVEKSKADQKYFAAMRSKDALSSENKVLKTQVSKSQELVGKLSELEKAYLNKIDILQKSEADLRSIKEVSIQDNHKLQEQLKSMFARQEHNQKEIKTLTSTIQEKSLKIHSLEKEIVENELKISRLEARNKESTNLIKKYRSNNTSAILQEDDKQLEALRSIAKCSVCSKNWKNTAITVCGHVFCNDCAQERLAARLRRCPTCNKGFSANDLLSIHL